MPRLDSWAQVVWVEVLVSEPLVVWEQAVDWVWGQVDWEREDLAREEE